MCYDLSNLNSDADLVLSRARALLGSLLIAPRAIVGSALPPKTNGVYNFSVEDEIIYVGEAAGSSGLRDRILSKHVSGDEGHALQSECKVKFPDRLDRRSFIKSSVSVQWVKNPDSLMVSLVEKLAIAAIKPCLNKAVVNRTER